MNFLHQGELIEITVPAGGVTHGLPVLVGAGIFGVAQNDGVSGDIVNIKRRGIFENQPKAAGAAWAQGDVLYWDNTALNFTKTAANNTRVGYAGDAAGSLSGDTTGTVLLDGHVG